jgi:hypothetical protein
MGFATGYVTKEDSDSIGIQLGLRVYRLALESQALEGCIASALYISAVCTKTNPKISPATEIPFGDLTLHTMTDISALSVVQSPMLMAWSI